MLVACALHLPRLHRPLGSGEINAGLFFGLAIRNWDAVGFAHTRGAPLGWQIWRPEQQAIPYLNHPPGLFWWMAALGTGEWAQRLPTVLAAAAAAVFLFLLLRAALGTLPAAIAGLTLLGAPTFALYSQASYETVVAAFGLGLWWAHAHRHAAGGAGRRWAVPTMLLAFLGAWMDWSFALFCGALVPLAASRNPAKTLRALALPAIAATFALATILAWKAWALASPHLHDDAAGGDLATTLSATILERPPLRRWLAGVAQLVPATASLPVALAAIAGIPVLLRRAPRLALALLFAGVSHFVLFGKHACDHVHFYCFFAVALAAASAALAAIGRPGGGLRRAGTIAALAVAAGAWLTTARALADDATGYYRTLGGVLDAAAGPDTGGPPGRVLHNAPRVYPYYVTSPEVLITPLVKLDVLRSLCHAPGRRHEIRYLWYRRARGPGVALLASFADPGLDEFLEQFPRRRMPDLEGSVRQPLHDPDWYDEVWLVAIPPPDR